MKHECKPLDEKKYGQLTDFISELFTVIRPAMYLQEWNFTLKFVEQDESDTIAGTNQCCGTYMQAILTFNVTLLQKFYDDKYGRDIALIVAHELAHCLTQPMFDYWDPVVSEREKELLRTMNETLTQRIANCVMYGLDATPKVYKIK